MAGLGDLLVEVSERELAELPAPQRFALERALLRRGGLPTGALDARALGSGLRSLMVRLSGRAPILVAVDDAQWLDDPTASALAFLVRRIDDARIAVVISVRAPVHTADPLGLRRALGDVRTSSLRLGPLSAFDIRGLVQSRTQRRLSPTVLARIAAASEGNPLYALEIARTIAAVPTLGPGDPLPVPDNLRELVKIRINGVQPSARRALLAAAALARPTVPIVERASSVAGLAAAEEAGLLRIDRRSIRFEHPLYASAIYGSASTKTRRALHVRLAGLVEDLEERARHLALGTVPPDERIATALEVAASQARVRGALESAGELLDMATTFTPSDATDAGHQRAVAAAEQYIHAGTDRGLGRCWRTCWLKIPHRPSGDQSCCCSRRSTATPTATTPHATCWSRPSMRREIQRSASPFTWHSPSSTAIPRRSRASTDTPNWHCARHSSSVIRRCSPRPWRCRPWRTSWAARE